MEANDEVLRQADMLHQLKAHPRQGGDQLLQFAFWRSASSVGPSTFTDASISCFEKAPVSFQHTKLLFQHVKTLANGHFGKIAIRRDTLGGFEDASRRSKFQWPSVDRLVGKSADRYKHAHIAASSDAPASSQYLPQAYQPLDNLL
jgi:hypothetical protein